MTCGVHAMWQDDGRSPVFIAAENNNVGALELLLKSDADVNACTVIWGVCT